MPQISLVQRTKCFACELWDDKPRLWFTLSFLLSVGGTCFTLGGLAALTAYCWDHQPLGLAAGFKLEPPYTSKTNEVMRIEKAVVTSTTGTFQCDKYFRYDWFLWTFQVVWLMIVGLVWWKRTLRTYQPALIGIGASITAWHMFKINYIISMEQWTQGDVHTDGIITSGGLIFASMGNFFMFLSGCNYAQYMAPPASHSNNMSGVDIGQLNGKGLNGKGLPSHDDDASLDV